LKTVTYFSALSSAPDQNHYVIRVHHGLSELLQKRYSSALLAFSKALNSRKRCEIIHPFHQIVYGVGLSLLLKQQPKEGFRYLYAIIPCCSRFANLWLRLAECCVLYFRQRVVKLRKQYQLTGVIARKLTTSTRTYTVLPMSDSRLFAKWAEIDEIGAMMTLEFAEKCARMAVELCGKNQLLEQKSVLLCQYICLEMGDWQRANELSQKLLGSSAEPFTRFLARVYASQACFGMKDYVNACAVLKPNLIEVQFNRTPEYGIMLYQTAWRTHQASQEVDKSPIYMGKALEVDPSCREVVLTKVAADLQNKKMGNALVILHGFKDKE
jgi:CCR4-NOT transcription complex subunit 10